MQGSEKSRKHGRGVGYKWITLSNTTLGVLMASVNRGNRYVREEEAAPAD